MSQRDEIALTLNPLEALKPRNSEIFHYLETLHPRLVIQSTRASRRQNRARISDSHSLPSQLSPLVGSRWLHLNATTVALAFLLGVLAISAFYGLRHAVFMSIIATLAFNYFFLPPIGTLTISDPQNWVALFAFLITAVAASELSVPRQAGGAHCRRAPARIGAPLRLQPTLTLERQRPRTPQ